MLSFQRGSTACVALLVAAMAVIRPAMAGDQAGSAAEGQAMALKRDLGALQLATDALTQADLVMTREDWGTAATLIQQGIDVLGRQYLGPDTLDETGTKLQLSLVEEQRGNLKVSTQLRRSVLQSRLTQFKKLHGLL